VVHHEFLAGSDDDYVALTEGLTPRYWNDYLAVVDHPLPKREAPSFVRAYKRRHPRYLVTMVYSVLAGIARTSNLAPFRASGKAIAFHWTFLLNLGVLLQWVSLRAGMPCFRIISDTTELPARFRRWARPFVLRVGRTPSTGSASRL
jgi:hypothetical protein